MRSRPAVECVRVADRLFLSPVEALPATIAEMTESMVPLALHRYATHEQAVAVYTALLESCAATAH